MSFQLSTFSSKRSFIRAILVLFLLFFYPPPACLAASQVVIDADGQFAYAEQLMENNDFSTAADEFKRFLHFFPEDPRASRAELQIGTAYFNSRRYPEAIAVFESFIQGNFDKETVPRAYMMLAECHSRQKSFGSAVLTMQNLIAMSDDNPDVRDEAHHRLGWLYVETASWDNAQNAFGKIRPESVYRPEDLQSALDGAASIDRKDPTLAGVLSIVPGGGQFYCERYQDAVIALLFNAGLILSAYEAFDNEMNALGAVLTFISFGFYSGNIYGAVNDARKFNRREEQKFIENMKNRFHFEISARPPGPSGNHPDFLVSFRYRF